MMFEFDQELEELPLFQPDLQPLTAYCNGAPLVLDPLVEDAARERIATVGDYYDSRVAHAADNASGAPYHPVEPSGLYLDETAFFDLLAKNKVARLSSFQMPPRGDIVELGGKMGRSFAAERSAGETNIFDVLIKHIRDVEESGRRPVLAAWTDGSRERLAQVIEDHGLTKSENVGGILALRGLKPRVLGLAVLPLETGFEIDDLVFIAEQDI